MAHIIILGRSISDGEEPIIAIVQNVEQVNIIVYLNIDISNKNKRKNRGLVWRGRASLLGWVTTRVFTDESSPRLHIYTVVTQIQ